MRLIAEELAEAGIASLAIRLPGHGTSPEDLARRNWEEWYDAVRTGHRILKGEFQSVYCMGMSTGCLLALVLASQEPVQGLVLFSPYLRVLHKLAPYAGWLRWIKPYHVRQEEEDNPSRYYNRRPVAGIHQINRLLKYVKPQLSEIDCPVLAFNGEGDQTVDIDSGREVIDAMGSGKKSYHRYGPEVPHVLTREDNPLRKAMFASTIGFIRELEA
jgi:carboxylesterase